MQKAEKILKTNIFIITKEIFLKDTDTFFFILNYTLSINIQFIYYIKKVYKNNIIKVYIQFLFTYTDCQSIYLYI